MQMTVKAVPEGSDTMKSVPFAMLCALLLAPTIAFAETADSSVGYGAATPGRLLAASAAVVGLISAILAGVSLARSGGRSGAGRRGAIAAAITGLIVIAYAVLHLSRFTGGFGTGSGRAGTIAAIVMGLTSIVLAAITLTRSRRAN
jgi:hypothetical protein